MLGDKNVFREAAKTETGRDVLSTWEADLKTGTSILGKSGLLCATDGGLIFVEAKFGKPGQIFDYPKGEVRAFEVGEAYLRVTLELETGSGPVTLVGRDRAGLDTMLAHAGMALPAAEESEPTPEPASEPAREPAPEPAQEPAQPPRPPRKIRKKSPPPPKPARDVKSLREAKKLTEALFEMIGNGDFDGTVRLLDRGAPVDGRDDEQQTPLMVAVEQGEVEIVRLLIERGADVDARDEDGETPLIHAASYDEPECVRILLEQGPELDVGEKYGGQTALMRTENIEVSQALLDAGADLEVRDEVGQNALASAANLGWDEKVQWLLDNGADPTAKDISGQTPLEVAEEAGEEVAAAMIRAMMSGETGAPPAGDVEELRLKKRLTEDLFEMVDDGDFDGVVDALERGAPVDGRDDEQQTPLMTAVEGGEIEIVRILIDRGADLAAVDEDGENPLIHAAGYDEPECVRLLLEKGAYVNARNTSDQQTALMLTDDLEVVKILLDAGAEIEARDDCGQTALAVASSAGEDMKVELLLERGADPTVKDEDGMTPLQLAQAEDEEVVVALLKSKLQ